MRRTEKIIYIQNIAVTVRKSRTRTLRLVIRSGGKATLSVPRFVSYKQALVFLEERKAWLIQKSQELPQQLHFLEQGKREEFLRYKEKARAIITARVTFWSKALRITYQGISVRNQKTRWGSASRTGRLNFTYRLIFLPEVLQDYVIVHELCHLRVFDHSERFWKEVAHVLPEYQKYRKQLQGFQQLIPH